MKMTNWWELDVWKAVNGLEPTAKTEPIVSECYQTPDGRKSTGIWAVTKTEKWGRRMEKASEQRRRLRLRIVVQPQASTISWLCLLFFNLLQCQPALIWHLFLLPTTSLSSIGFLFLSKCGISFVTSPSCETIRDAFLQFSLRCIPKPCMRRTRTWTIVCRVRPWMWTAASNQQRVTQSILLRSWDQRQHTRGCEERTEWVACFRSPLS